MFVSDLFVQQLVSSDCVFGCLQMITSRISVLEDVLAVHAIISHANERLYDRQTMYAFMGAFKQRARMICNNASAVGEQFTQAHVQPYVQVSNGHGVAGGRCFDIGFFSSRMSLIPLKNGPRQDIRLPLRLPLVPV